MTKIEWTDATWNPIIGCSRISEECRFCYAATAAATPRLQQFPQYQGVEKWDGTLNFAESQLRKPSSWQKPKRIFVCSMSDLFHGNVRLEWLDRVFAVMGTANHHTYQILTKRPERMLEYVTSWSGPLRHIWLGTTAGCQSSVDKRLPVIDKLTRLGWTTFVSAEPLLEEISLGFGFPGYRVDQVITGAESGRGARPMQEDWVRSLRDQCQSAGVAFFYKQDFQKGKKISLPELDGKQWAEMPK